MSYSLWKEHGVKSLPGSYLTHSSKLDSSLDKNPGSKFIRLALVHSLEKTRIGLNKIAKALKLETGKEIKPYGCH